MPNPYASKKSTEATNPYAAKKAVREPDQTKANPWSRNRRNGKPAPTVPRTLGELLGQKRKAKEKPLPQKQCKEDFYHSGVLFWNATVTDGVNDIPFDGKIVPPRGTVDVSNGDMTYTFHNRYGSWMADVGSDGRMAEPAWVAAALGTGMNQVTMYHNIVARFESELKKRGILTRDQQRILLEKAADEQRRLEREAAAKAKAKAESSTKKTNPYAKKAGK